MVEKNRKRHRNFLENRKELEFLIFFFLCIGIDIENFYHYFLCIGIGIENFYRYFLCIESRHRTALENDKSKKYRLPTYPA